MGVSWEEMCQQVVIDGRPGDVASAALGWTELLKNLRSVKESLEKNTADLGAVWKGPAFDSFKEHVDGIAKTTGRLIEDAEKGDGIVHSLNAAADRLTEAQREFPIPASCVNDVLEARNGHLTIGVGFFEAKVAPDFLGLLDPIAGLADWLNDRTDEAAQVYNQVNNQYQGQAATMPGEASTVPTQRNPNLETPNLNTGGTGGAPGSVPSLPGGGPGTPGTPNVPPPRTPELGPVPGEPPGGPRPPGGFEPPPGGPRPPGFDDPPSGPGGPDEGSYGSGLASAAPPTSAGPGGLPSTSGLGGGGGLSGGAGAGSVPGGGALGRPVATMVPPMMGGGAAGAGRGGGGRAAGGRLGGMPGMLGGAAGGPGGRGAAGGGRGAGGPAVGARGAIGGRGGLAGVGAGGAGYGEDEADRSTWLDEDEDVWGADGDGLPGVLR